MSSMLAVRGLWGVRFWGGGGGGGGGGHKVQGRTLGTFYRNLTMTSFPPAPSLAKHSP